MKPIRSALLAALVGAAALIPVATPAQATPAKHVVMMMVTSIDVPHDFDSAGGCGDFGRIDMTAAGEEAPASSWTNIIPKGKNPEVWNPSAWVTSFPLCQNSTYTVDQTDLPAVADHLKGFSNDNMLFVNTPMTAANINRMSFTGAPGTTKDVHALAWEYDAGWLSHAVGKTKTVVKVPAAGKNGTFSLPIVLNAPFQGTHTALILRGTITTSATPA